MKKPKKIILFDIDYTLFDTDLYIESFFPFLGKELGINNTKEFDKISQMARIEAREKTGFFDPETFLKIIIKSAKKPVSFEELEAIFFNNQFFASSLYKDTVSVLDKLQKHKNFRIGILSAGHTKYQLAKIQTLKKFFKKSFIHIFPDKIRELKNVLEGYKNYAVYLVDDNLSVLEEAKKIDNAVITMWLKKQTRHEIINKGNTFKPDYTFSNLYDILSVLKN